MAATCQCGAPLPRGWFFVALCDPCLDRALEGLPEPIEAEIVDDEED